MAAPAHRHRHPLAAGALAGACEITVTYPLQLLKTRLQLAPRGAYGGVVDCARCVVAAHGPRGLYRGLSANLAFALPRVGSRFAVFEGLVHARALGGVGQRARVLLAGAAAGCAEALVAVIPMTTLEVRLVADASSGARPRFRGFAHAVREIYADEGARGLYRGAGPTLAKITFNIAARFGLYDALSEALGAQWDALAAARRRRGGDSDSGSGGSGSGGNGGGGGSSSGVGDSGDSGSGWRLSCVSIAAGGIAGALTAAANHPIDVVKSNMQGLDARRYSSALHCARTILAAEGARGLYKGLTARLVRVVLETALTFAFYEHFSRWLAGRARGY